MSEVKKIFAKGFCQKNEIQTQFQKNEIQKLFFTNIFQKNFFNKKSFQKKSVVSMKFFLFQITVFFFQKKQFF